MDKIKIGQIGVSHEHAGVTMNAFRLLPDIFEVVGIVDDQSLDTPKTSNVDLSYYEGLKWMTEDELLNTPGLQAVAVEVPNLELVPVALRCARRNLSIHMDKPGGNDAALFSTLRHECENRNLSFQIGYMFRANPAMLWIRDAAAKGMFGEIFELQSSMSHCYGGEAYQEYLGKFQGGIMFNLGCHFIDFIVSLMGRPAGVTSFLKAAPGTPENIKNNCMTIFDYPNATATIRACSLEAGGLEHRRLKICGTNATAELSPIERFDGKPLQMRFIVKEDTGIYKAGEHIIDFGIIPNRYKDHLLEFASMIRGEIRNPYTTGHDCLVQELIMAASGYCAWKKQ